VPTHHDLNAFGKVSAGGASNLSMTITNTTTGEQFYSGDFGGLVDGAVTAVQLAGETFNQ
jgi:hypothetical protein